MVLVGVVVEVVRAGFGRRGGAVRRRGVDGTLARGDGPSAGAVRLWSAGLGRLKGWVEVLSWGGLSLPGVGGLVATGDGTLAEGGGAVVLIGGSSAVGVGPFSSGKGGRCA